MTFIYFQSSFLFYQKFSHGCFLATDLSEQICMKIKYSQKGTAKAQPY